METFTADVKQAIRLLRGNRAFAAAALATIALGVGGSTAVFSIIYGVLLRPLPYADPERIVRLWEVHPGANAPLGGALLTQATYAAWARESSTLDGIAGFRVSDYTVAAAGTAERVRGARVTPSLFPVLRVSPAAGRLFTPADAQPGGDRVVVLGCSMWRQRFGSDPGVIGTPLAIDGVDHLIVGVASQGFAFPEHEGNWSDRPRAVMLYTPLAVPEAGQDPKVVGIIEAIGRLRPQRTTAQAEAEGTAHARAAARPLADLVFGSGRPVEVRVRTTIDQMTMRVQPALLMLGATVGLVLLIGCANLATLFLARGMDRARELAIRAAVGAGRARLWRQLLTEALVVALVGGAGGVAVAFAALAALPAFAPPGFPRLQDVHVDVWFLLGAAVAATLVAAVAGIVSANGNSRVDLGGLMQSGGARSTGLPARRLRRLLLVVEAALAVVLLIGATLLARSLTTLLQVDPGYQPAGVLTADLYVMGARGEAAGTRTSELTVAAVERLRGTPGVLAVGAGNMMPFGGVLSSVGFGLPGMTNADGSPVVARALHAVVTPGYAEALGLRLQEGRFFDVRDLGAPIQPMIVNDSFARTYFADGRPVVGRRFTGIFPGMLRRPDAAFDVVGVVEDVLPSLDAAPQPQIYVVHGGGFDMGRAALVVRTERDPVALIPIVRQVVRQLAPDGALDRVGPLGAKVSSSVGEPRFAVFVVAAFALLALALAATGLYAALYYDVMQRRRELGIRGALGATKLDIARLVLREGVAVTATGLAVGVLLSVFALRVTSGLLFGVTPLDPVAFVVGPLILAVVAFTACLIPARRAAAFEPTTALEAP